MGTTLTNIVVLTSFFRHCGKVFAVACIWAFVVAQAAQADVIFDWATVGDTGNAVDSTGFGAVGYVYQISKHEVTNGQYVEFLNAVSLSDPNGLWNSNMRIARSGTSGSYNYSATIGYETRPVNYVSYFNAMRFVNWLENGQQVGAQGPATTESGAYTIGTGLNEVRSPGTRFFMPSLDEWYKAAYYDPTSAPGDHYWSYPTRSDTAPAGHVPPGGVNSANVAESNIQDTTNVGAYTGTTSYYGGFDFAGNLWEWNEGLLNNGRVLRGGSYAHLASS